MTSPRGQWPYEMPNPDKEGMLFEANALSSRILRSKNVKMQRRLFLTENYYIFGKPNWFTSLDNQKNDLTQFLTTNN